MKKIETAPRDGTLILGIVEMNSIVLARTARWFETETNKYNPDGGFWMCPNAKTVIGPFTHWMENPKQLVD
jgi:hypothetical protein